MGLQNYFWDSCRGPYECHGIVFLPQEIRISFIDEDEADGGIVGAEKNKEKVYSL